jgi:secondary thiamine-phosphate synthase enzyme
MKFIKTSIASSHENEMINITQIVWKFAWENHCLNGRLMIFIPHTTAGITINENADPDVVHDMLYALDQMVPLHSEKYRHGEGNSAAHVKSSLVGCQVQVLVQDGELVLGRWQGIFFCEFDGPRTRQMIISFLEE